MKNLEFHSPKALISRSALHLWTFEQQIYKYRSSRPFIKNTHIDELGFKIWSATIVKEIPVEIGCIIFDTINCLRSSLDHAVYAGATMLGVVDKPKNLKFPFGRSIQDLHNEFKGNAKSVPDVIRKVILQTMPYENGNREFWAFNAIRNENIHRILSATIQSSSVGVGGNGVIEELSLVSSWIDETRTFTYARGKGIDEGIRVNLGIDICFDSTSPLPNKDVFKLLNDMYILISGVIYMIEREVIKSL